MRKFMCWIVDSWFVDFRWNVDPMTRDLHMITDIYRLRELIYIYMIDSE